jgi:putative ABC transport system permease protein
MFEVPFLYGRGWASAADRGPAAEIVLSKEYNQKLFGGINSVGRMIRWNDREFRIVGVLDDWFPVPKYYDLNGSNGLSKPEDVFIPFGWVTAMELIANGGSNECWRAEEINSFQAYLNSDCVWMQMWVELPDATSRARMQTVIDNYWAEQRKAGRFERPRNNRLTNVSQWLADNEVVQSDNRVLVGLAFAFLAVCLINTVGLLLAKFLNAATLTGVRRALGASRKQIITQHLVEVGVLASSGALLGLVLGALGLWGVHALYSTGQTGRGGYRELANFDTSSVVIAIVLAIVATLAAGLYPAWRVGRVPPAVYLKSQ